MDDGAGGGIAPFPSPLPVAGGGHGHVNNRASSAVAAASVALILLYLFWKFMWQCRKNVAPRRDDNAASPSSSAQRPEPWPPCGTTADPERGENKTRMPVPASPVRVDDAPSDSGDAADKAECAVCLVEFGRGGEAAGRFVPGCGHGFHAACIEAWFRVRPTCPLCRAAVVVPGLPEPNPGRLERS